MNRIFIKLAKFKGLSRSERHTLLIAMVWLPLFWFGLRVLGLHRFQTLLLRNSFPLKAGQMQGSPERSRRAYHERLNLKLSRVKLETDEIIALANLVNIAARQPFIPVTCLTRSLLLSWMLQQRGIAGQLRIGVRLVQGKLDAHAWVEYQGIPINDQVDVADQFAPFDEILPPEAFPLR